MALNHFKSYYYALFLILFLTTGVAVGQSIDRIEPPFWWTGLQDTGLQLLVHGKDISRLRPAVARPGISVRRVVTTANPNYLFVYMDIGPDTRAGDFDIVFTGAGVELSSRYALRQKNPDAGHVQGFGPEDAIYLITPDRFANGSPDNDNIAELGDTANRRKPGGRHGGDIAGMIDYLDYIDEMGFTAIWLNPLLENRMPTYSYHGYSTTDFYRVDPRYGSNEDYRELVRQAAARGIGVIMDMIVNHCGSEHWWMADLPADDWINFTGSYRETSHERTAVQDPYAARADLRAFADGWFAPTMPDLNQRNPLMADYLIQNAIWWIEYLGLSGIRMDTYPYPDKHFMTEWTRRVMLEYPDFNVVGEEWSLNPAIVAYWQRGKINHDGYLSFLPSVMDFPLQDALVRGLTAEEQPHRSGLITLYRALANDFLYANPAALVTFGDNHDMRRIFSQLDEDYDLFRMAMVYLLTMRGTPQIYYGTEILMSSSDDHGDIRSDFPGGWPGDRKDARSGKGLSDEQKSAQRLLRTLLNWRKNQPVIHAGELVHFQPVDGVYVWFRYNESGRVMAVINKNRRERELDLARFGDYAREGDAALDVLAATRFRLGPTLQLPARSVALIELEENFSDN